MVPWHGRNYGVGEVSRVEILNLDALVFRKYFYERATLEQQD